MYLRNCPDYFNDNNILDLDALTVDLAKMCVADQLGVVSPRRKRLWGSIIAKYFLQRSATAAGKCMAGRFS
jgi:hypothetical protein